MNSRSIRFLLAAVAIPVGLLLLISGTAVHAAKDSRTKKSGPAAVVNGHEISRAAYERQLNNIRRSLQQSGQSISEVQMNAIKGRILDHLIDQELLFQAAQKKGFRGDPQAVDARIADFKKRFDSPQAYTQALQSMDLTEDALRKELLRTSAIQQFIDKELASKIQISEADARRFYEEKKDAFQRPERVHARHILVKVSSNASPEEKKKARAKIEDLQKRLKKGEDFASLAASSSDCPSREKGGDLGFFARGQMVKPFEDAAFALKPGEVSGVVETQFGYHLIQVLEKKPPETVPFSQVKDRIIEHLRTQKTRSVVETFLTDARSKAKITKAAVEEL